MSSDVFKVFIEDSDTEITGNTWLDVLNNIGTHERNTQTVLKIQPFVGLRDVDITLQQAFGVDKLDMKKFFYHKNQKNLYVQSPYWTKPTQENLQQSRHLLDSKIIVKAHKDKEMEIERELITINILSLKNKYTIQISENENILSLKQKLYCFFCVESDKIRLFYKGNDLDNKTTLKENQIQSNDSIHISLPSVIKHENYCGILLETKELLTTNVQVMDKMVFVHPFWSCNEFVEYFIISQSKSNANRFLQSKFKSTAIRLFKKDIEEREEKLNQDKRTLEREKEKFNENRAHLNIQIGDDEYNNLDSVVPKEIREKLELLVRREEELRKSPDVQKLYQQAEEREDTDWIEVTMKLRQQVLEEFGITGPDRFTILEYAARRYEAFYVKENLASKCNLQSGDVFRCSDIHVYDIKNNSLLFLDNALQTSHPLHLLIAGSIS